MTKSSALISRKKRIELQNPSEPNLFREQFPYRNVPRVLFDGHEVPMNPPAEIWITDTTFRDGQQARPPYTPKQVAQLYEFLYRLGGRSGVIRQCEFFLYSSRDRKAVELCLAKGYEYPEVTGWIRARVEDFGLVREMGLAETGILTSASDYHIYNKLGMDRKQAFEQYLGIVRAALDAGIRPRCHLEDITRADFYGFVVPFAQALMDLEAQSRIPIKIRLCDTLGFGVGLAAAALPRSIPKLIHGLIHEAGVPSERLEWHGHNDFHLVHANGMAAWLYGCSALNCTILGFGERTGNPPIEAAALAYISLTGRDQDIDTTVITEIAEYCERELGFKIPADDPFVGSEFNSTSAGIHADGAAKDREIYTIFDTEKILNRPLGITINDKSGVAGIALWVNMHFKLDGERQVSKKHPGVARIAKEIQRQYEQGRSTTMSTEEMESLARKHIPELAVSDLDRMKRRAGDLALHLVERLSEAPEFKRMDVPAMERTLQAMADENPFIQYCYVTDLSGMKVTRNITQRTEAAKYKEFGKESFADREWFTQPLKNGKPHVTGLYTSKLTQALCITVSDVIENDQGEIVGVLGIDIKFEELIRAEPAKTEDLNGSRRSEKAEDEGGTASGGCSA